jgi:uncharacterized protein (TIGR02646 family)
MVYFKKSQPAPNSLVIEKEKKSGTYNKDDVVTQLKINFHNKCYICEQKNPTTINIEHFKSHQGDIDLKFSWNNLFLSCGHCNNIKLDSFDNILNCTILKDRVDTVLHYHCNPFPKERAEFKILIASERAEETKKLLEKSFNGEHTPQKTLESSYLRDLLVKEIRVFQTLLFDYYESSGEDKEYFFKKIKFHLSNESAFTAFKRWIIRDSEYLNKDFQQLFYNS